MRFWKLCLFLFLPLLWIGCQQHKAHQQDGPGTCSSKDGVFIHISNGFENPHKVLMALSMATLMADTQDVCVYLDIKGVNVVLKDAQDLNYSHFASAQTQIKALVDKGVPVLACPGCLKAAEKTPADLMDGVRVADKETFFGFTKGRILTLDY
jgi:predicted peroxiredoxin